MALLHNRDDLNLISGIHLEAKGKKGLHKALPGLPQVHTSRTGTHVSIGQQQFLGAVQTAQWVRAPAVQG